MSRFTPLRSWVNTLFPGDIVLTSSVVTFGNLSPLTGAGATTLRRIVPSLFSFSFVTNAEWKTPVRHDIVHLKEDLSITANLTFEDTD